MIYNFKRILLAIFFLQFYYIFSYAQENLKVDLKLEMLHSIDDAIYDKNAKKWIINIHTNYALVKVDTDILDAEFFYCTESGAFADVSSHSRDGELYLQINPGKRKITINAPKFKPYTFQEQFFGGKSYTLTIGIRENADIGILSIDSTPKGATAIVEIKDRKIEEKTPHKFFVPSGIADITLIHPTYKCIKIYERIAIRSYESGGENVFIRSFPLSKTMQAKVFICASPQEAALNALLYIDGRCVNCFPYDDSLTIGEHKIKVVKEGFELAASDSIIDVNPCDKPNRFSLNLLQWGTIKIDLGTRWREKVVEVKVNNEKAGSLPFAKSVAPDSSVIVALYDKEEKMIGESTPIKVPLNETKILRETDFKIIEPDNCWKKYKHHFLGGLAFSALIYVVIREIKSIDNGTRKLPAPPLPANH